MALERQNGARADADRVEGTAWRDGAVRFVFFAFLAVVVTVGYSLAQFRGLHEPVSMETAQIARHLAEGRGFVTHCIRPFDLWVLQQRERVAEKPDTPGNSHDGHATHGIPAEAGTTNASCPGSEVFVVPPSGGNAHNGNGWDAPVPALWTAPGLPALQAVLFRLARPRYAPRRADGFLNDAETGVIVPLGLVLTLLTTLAVWLLGRVLFNDRTALLAAGGYAVADLTLSSAISGLPAPASALAATLALLLAVLAVRRSAAVEGGWGVAALALLSALCAAAAVLAEYAMLVAAAGAAALLATELQRRRWRLLALYLLVLALALLPWLLCNTGAGIGVFGALPYAALRETPLFPGDSLERSVQPVFNLARMAAAVRHGFAARLMLLAGGEGLLRAGVVLGFFILAVFHRYDRPACRTLKAVTLVSVIALALLPVAPGMTPGNGWIAFYPVVVLFGMSAFTDFLDREDYFDPGIRPLLTVLLLALCALPAGLRVLHGPAFAYPPIHAPVQRFAAGASEEGKALLTDIPWATAWYGGRASVLLPPHPEDVTALPGGWPGIGGVYLTAPDRGGGDGAILWTLMLLGRQIPESVPFTQGLNLPVGRRDQLLLTRTPLD